MKITRYGTSRNSDNPTHLADDVVVDTRIPYVWQLMPKNGLDWIEADCSVEWYIKGFTGKSTYGYIFSAKGSELALLVEKALLARAEGLQGRSQAKAIGTFIREALGPTA